MAIEHEPSGMPRLVTITTHPISTRNLMRGQLAYMRERGFDVTAVSAPGWELDEVAEREGVATVEVPMQRDIHPWADLVSLVRMIRLMRRLRPDIVNAGTPKAALVGLLAATLARVPVRIYTQRKLRLEQVGGWKRALLWVAERITALCSHRVICVSPSLRDLFVAMGFAPREKTIVIRSGGSNGVNAERFHPRDRSADEVRALRAELGLPEGVPVMAFVGRLVRDKGFAELLAAFERVRSELPEARLLVVGDFEACDAVAETDIHRARRDSHVVISGFVPDTAPYYALIDVVAFPSYVEGFPNVPLEAAAAEVPVVGFQATGTVDAIEDGKTGRIVPAGDVEQLAGAVLSYLQDPELRERHGRAGRQRVLRDFQQEPIWTGLYEVYVQLLTERGLPVPHPVDA